MRKFQFTVRISVTSEPTEDELVAYVAQALHYWGGQYNPSHPLFTQHIERVSVDGVTAAAWSGPMREFGSAKKRRKPRRKV